LSSAIILSILILSVEKTIQSNNVSPEEQQWGLAQTFAIILSLLPVCGICKHIVFPSGVRKELEAELAKGAGEITRQTSEATA